MTIPSGQEDFVVRAHCSDQCSRNSIPADGITITAAEVSMHQTGFAAVARHFRGGEEILPPIATNEKYDFMRQRLEPLSTPRKFLPGDRILLECHYRTTDKALPTFGGEGSDSEMCVATFQYYPKADLEICGSSVTIATYLEAFGASPSRSLKLATRYGPAKKSGVSKPTDRAKVSEHVPEGLMKMPRAVQSFVKQIQWNKENVAKLQALYYEDASHIRCSTTSGEVHISSDSWPKSRPWKMLQDNSPQVFSSHENKTVETSLW